MSENLNQQSIEHLELLYDKAVKNGDEIVADLICYLISEKQQEILQQNH
jgi:hypothetical protein